MGRAGATVVDVRLPKWLLEAKGEYYDAIRYPEFTAQIADYLKTLGPTYPKTVDELIARGNAFNALRPDGAGPNPVRWNLMKRESGATSLTDYRYTSVRDYAMPMVRSIVEGILSSQRLDAIVYPTLPKRPPLLTAPPEPPGGAAGTPANLANLTMRFRELSRRRDDRQDVVDVPVVGRRVGWQACLGGRLARVKR